MEDGKIIQLFFERNEEALTEFSRKYGGYCTIVANNVIGNREDAEECVNGALLELWNSIPPQTPKNLRAFAGKIVRGNALDLIKKMNAAKRGGKERFTEELTDIPSGYSVEAAAERREVIAAVNDYLKRLDARKRTVFVLKYWYCCEVSEIAGITGFSEANVYNILKRERKKLMEYLRKREVL